MLGDRRCMPNLIRRPTREPRRWVRVVTWTATLAPVPYSVSRLVWAVGIPLGLLMSTVTWVGIVVEPYLNFLRALPPLGYIGLLIVWFGIGDTSKIWLLFLAAMPPIHALGIHGSSADHSRRTMSNAAAPAMAQITSGADRVSRHHAAFTRRDTLRARACQCARFASSEPMPSS